MARTWVFQQMLAAEHGFNLPFLDFFIWFIPREIKKASWGSNTSPQPIDFWTALSTSGVMQKGGALLSIHDVKALSDLYKQSAHVVSKYATIFLWMPVSLASGRSQHRNIVAFLRANVTSNLWGCAVFLLWSERRLIWICQLDGF